MSNACARHKVSACSKRGRSHEEAPSPFATCKGERDLNPASVLRPEFVVDGEGFEHDLKCRLTIYYTESFRLFPENWGDIRIKIGSKPDDSSELSRYRSILAYYPETFRISPQIGILSGNRAVWIKSSLDRASNFHDYAIVEEDLYIHF
jgi:hypothetical protein